MEFGHKIKAALSIIVPAQIENMISIFKQSTFSERITLFSQLFFVQRVALRINSSFCSGRGSGLQKKKQMAENDRISEEYMELIVTLTYTAARKNLQDLKASLQRNTTPQIVWYESSQESLASSTVTN